MISRAVISDCGKYRYKLERIWDERKSGVVFIMLNPSTADASVDDPTVRRCINYAKKWGYGSLTVLNLYAFKSTDPGLLSKLTSSEKVGIENGDYLFQAKFMTHKIVVAWGVGGGDGSVQFRSIFKNIARLYCLDTTKDGYPRHPLYCKKDLTLKRWIF